MKTLICKASLVLVLAFGTSSCAWVQENACAGATAVRDTVNDGLSYIPVIGPWSGQITNLVFDLFCAIVGAPAEFGKDIDNLTGVQLDPTATGAAVDDSGS